MDFMTSVIQMKKSRCVAKVCNLSHVTQVESGGARPIPGHVIPGLITEALPEILGVREGLTALSRSHLVWLGAFSLNTLVSSLPFLFHSSESLWGISPRAAFLLRANTISTITEP